jgi:hypothetical protein
MSDLWPALPLDGWRDTYDTLHRWTQIVASAKKRLSPYMDEWWHEALQLSARGLTTGPIPYAGGAFEISLDFVDHLLRCDTSNGERRRLSLLPRSVAAFYEQVEDVLASIGIHSALDDLPEEIENPIAFREDVQNASYDRVAVERWWRTMTDVSVIFRSHHSSFRGKASPVQFFTGSFDLSYVRYSGLLKKASAERDAAMVEQRIESGFWPGGRQVAGAAFYSFPAPAEPNIGSIRIQPPAALCDSQQGYYLLMYDDVRTSESPAEAILAFLQSTYEASAGLARWDRQSLEQVPPDRDGS